MEVDHGGLRIKGQAQVEKAKERQSLEVRDNSLNSHQTLIHRDPV